MSFGGATGLEVPLATKGPAQETASGEEESSAQQGKRPGGGVIGGSAIGLNNSRDPRGLVGRVHGGRRGRRGGSGVGCAVVDVDVSEPEVECPGGVAVEYGGELAQQVNVLST